MLIVNDVFLDAISEIFGPCTCPNIHTNALCLSFLYPSELDQENTKRLVQVREDIQCRQ